ncbi:sugar ABC transporter ATP-binding protein [Chondrinema litorale]|uniref:sugar ABC transporter ATP-binding protein n=1 Tax=Chondrinema litorale TaxID=2994555 RepID=UPI00254373D3|nr:sugar ABC transporter ATP-binding protein [Chondrinema litorale]UZR98450.1 sugar ABC transporter ATP-binding protein [Chondrinema litorale]
MTAEQPILTAQNITKKFAGTVALDQVNLEVYKGKVNVIVGENGAGKSTLMKILSGVYNTYEGKLFLDGEEVSFKTPREANDKGIAIIHQELNLIPYLSITENIFLGRELVNKFGFLDYETMHAQSREWLKKLDFNIDPKTKVSKLRIGEQQLIEIAKALSLNARVIIMDEPTSAISDSEVEILFRIIEDIKKKDVAILYISHKLDELFKIADRFIALRDGQMVGKIEDVSHVKKEDLIRFMVGRDIKNTFQRTKIPYGEEILRIEDLSFYKNLNTEDFWVQNVSLSVRKGEILGIFGLMGAGRTELFEAIFGLHPNRVTGKIYIEGKEVKINSVCDAIKAGLGLVPENRKKDGLVLQMNIAKNISMADTEQVVKSSFLNDVLECKLAKYYINKINIKTTSEKNITKNLSGGNQQKVVIGKWLATCPKVLFLDEPTRGIDVNAKNEIYHLIEQLAKEGLAVVVVSSELPEIMTISDRILVMSQSKIDTEFKSAEANEDAIMTAAIK